VETLDTNFLLNASLIELIAEANKTRSEFVGDEFELCSIINAKSGLCGEDCKFCAQSSRHNAETPTYSLKDKTEIVEAGREAKRIGAMKFGIVTSGNLLAEEEIDVLVEAIKIIKDEIDIDVCGSLGALTKEQMLRLKQAGMSRYHHNIETSENFYPKIVSTHKFEERVRTIKAAKEVGMEVCSGGILGIGESWQDRFDMAMLLKELEVDSVPINFLVPIKGTPMEKVEKISYMDAVRAICIFRIILKDKIIKIAAGREEVFKDFQTMGFMSGANGMLIGGYLTVKGRSVEQDHKLVSEVKKAWAQ